MDWSAVKDRISGIFGKYKYVALVLAVGILLMTLPESGEKQEAIPQETAGESSVGISENLEEILSQIDGVGRVRVLLTESAGAETLYQTDEDSTVSSDSQSVRMETVMFTDSARAEQGLVRQVIPAVYLGAVVVCQGAERPSVRLSVVEAVANVTGISTDRITVLKMK